MRYERNTAVLLKMETVYGTDSLPVPATDAILLRKFSSKQEIKYENVPEVRPYMGAGLDLVGETHITGTFEVSLGGSGTVDVPPQWGKFLRCSGFAETINATASVDYTLISEALESATIYYYDSGVLKKATGLRCNITGYKKGYGGVPTLAVSFIALDAGDTAVVPPTVTLAAWKTPLPVNTTNSGLLTIGATYAAGALTGGTTYPSTGLDLSLGGKLAYQGILGGEEVDFTDRGITGKITLDLTAAQEIAMMAIVKAGTMQSFGLLHGVAAGYKLLTFMPNVQLKNPAKGVMNGKRVITYDLKSVPTEGVGNDELRIVAL